MTLVNEGASTGGGVGGWTFFSQQASVENGESAAITSRGGTASGAPGGNLRSTDDATAGIAALINASGTTADALGGTTQVLDRASASGASIVNAGGSVAGAFGGTTDFGALSNAGHATLVNAAGELTGTVGGSTHCRSAGLDGPRGPDGEKAASGQPLPNPGVGSTGARRLDGRDVESSSLSS